MSKEMASSFFNDAHTQVEKVFEAVHHIQGLRPCITIIGVRAIDKRIQELHRAATELTEVLVSIRSEEDLHEEFFTHITDKKVFTADPYPKD